MIRFSLMTLSFFLSFAVQSGRAQSSPSDAPAEALFQNASLQFHTQGDLDWAIRDFETLIHLYPAYPRKNEAILMLAELRLMKNDPTSAIEWAQKILTTTTKHSERLKARMILGNAYWVSEKTTELAALGQELIQSKDATSESKTYGYLFLAEAHLRRGNFLESARFVTRAENILKTHTPNLKSKPLLALAESVKMRVNLSRCQNQWKNRPKDERTHRAHFQEASQCLLGGLISFKSVLEWDRNGIYREPQKAIQTAYTQWVQWFKNPLPNGNKIQSKELQQWFKEDLSKHLSEASSLIQHWKQSSLPLQKQIWEELGSQLQSYRKEL
jgi:tetratricopeptide (TPR) repeat protein